MNLKENNGLSTKFRVFRVFGWSLLDTPSYESFPAFTRALHRVLCLIGNVPIAFVCIII